MALTPTVSPPTAGLPPNAAMACGAAAEYAAEHWNLILRAVAAPANGGGELRLLADEDMEDRLHKIFEQRARAGSERARPRRPRHSQGQRFAQGRECGGAVDAAGGRRADDDGVEAENRPVESCSSNGGAGGAARKAATVDVVSTDI